MPSCCHNDQVEVTALVCDGCGDVLAVEPTPSEVAAELDENDCAFVEELTGFICMDYSDHDGPHTGIYM